MSVKIRYRGKFIGGQWVYDSPKVVELPIPFISKSEKTGEVTCNPIGDFPDDFGYKLLAMSGKDGPFIEEIVNEKKQDSQPAAVPLSTKPVSENIFIKQAKAQQRHYGRGWPKGRKRSPSPKAEQAESPSPQAGSGQEVKNEQDGI